MSARVTATDRMRRLLALVPWVAAHPDGAPIDEACRRFGLTEEQLVDELNTVPFVGLYPYSPDELIEVDVHDGKVHVLYSAGFRRPLRLTPGEGLALVAAGTALLSTPGADPDGPLARGLAKVAGVLGVRPNEDLAIRLGPDHDGILDTLHTALSSGRRVEIDYYSHGRDEVSTRAVDVWRLWSHDGYWYVGGFCHLAGGERVFRVDRVARATLLDDEATPPEAGAGADFLALDELPQVVLDLAPGARWLVDTIPVRQLEERPDGTVRVTLAVTATPWIERLLLQLGPDASVVEIDPRLGPPDLAAAAARRLLARYGVTAP